MRKLLLMAAGFALLSTASLFATRESAQARSGNHLGVIWSMKEDQNVWRMPQQLNKMGNNVQFTRSASTFGGAHGGFFLNKKDMKSTFGFDLPVNFGLYFNNDNRDFKRVSNNNCSCICRCLQLLISMHLLLLQLV